MKKIISLFTLIVLILAIITITGCQPTPDTPPIVYRGEGLPKGCIIAPLADSETRDIMVPSRWEEETERAEGWVRFTADIDLESPQIGNTPVIEYKQKELVDEDLCKLVKYFAGDNKLYVYPELTKEEWEFQSEQVLKKNGYYINPARNPDRASILARIDKETVNASDSIKKEYVEPSFSNPLRSQFYYIMTGENKKIAEDAKYYFQVLVETDDEHDPMIKSTTYNTQAGSSSDFIYQKGAYLSADDIYDLYTLVTSFKDTEHEVYNPVSIEHQKKLENYYNSVQDYVDSSAEPSSETQAVADKVLADLNIDDVLCTGIDKCIALNISCRRWDAEFDERTASIAYAFNYTLSPSDGLSCYVPQRNKNIVFSEESTPEDVFKPSFGTEEITIVVADNEVYAFSWKNMSEDVGIIAKNTELLDFEQCKGRALDHVGYEIANSLGIVPEGAERTYMYNYYAQNVELGYYNITAYDKPERVWSIPVWIFSFDIYGRTFDPETYLGDGEALWGGGTVLIDALDGAYISIDSLIESSYE